MCNKNINVNIGAEYSSKNKQVFSCFYSLSQVLASEELLVLRTMLLGHKSFGLS